MSKTIEKKILPQYFKDIANGRKNFELRKDEDSIQPYDVLVLREFDEKKYTGYYISIMVDFVLRNCEQYGLMNGYVIIGLGKVLDYAKY